MSRTTLFAIHCSTTTTKNTLNVINVTIDDIYIFKVVCGFSWHWICPPCPLPMAVCVSQQDKQIGVALLGRHGARGVSSDVHFALEGALLVLGARENLPLWGLSKPKGSCPSF